MSVSDVCSVDVQALYLEDPGNKKDIAGYVLCSEMVNTCVKNGCSCRSAESAVVNGSPRTLPYSSSGSAASSEPEAQNESSVAAISTTNTKATTESKSVASTSASGSGSVDIVSVSSNAASAATMSTTVMIVIIVVAVVFVALVSWVVRTYCMGRSAKQSKLPSRRNRSINFDATSPTNLTGRTSATPSFPAFDRRTRAMQSPTGEDVVEGSRVVQTHRVAAATQTCRAEETLRADETLGTVNRTRVVGEETPTWTLDAFVASGSRRLDEAAENPRLSLGASVATGNQLQDVGVRIPTWSLARVVVETENRHPDEAEETPTCLTEPTLECSVSQIPDAVAEAPTCRGASTRLNHRCVPTGPHLVTNG
ncbi:hypothetical protein PRNP1_009774 [Phytophthora ramorum]